MRTAPQSSRHAGGPGGNPGQLSRQVAVFGVSSCTGEGDDCPGGHGQAIDRSGNARQRRIVDRVDGQGQRGRNGAAQFFRCSGFADLDDDAVQTVEIRVGGVSDHRAGRSHRGDNRAGANNRADLTQDAVSRRDDEGEGQGIALHVAAGQGEGQRHIFGDGDRLGIGQRRGINPDDPDEGQRWPAARPCAVVLAGLVVKAVLASEVGVGGVAKRAGAVQGQSAADYIADQDRSEGIPIQVQIVGEDARARDHQRGEGHPGKVGGGGIGVGGGQRGAAVMAHNAPQTLVAAKGSLVAEEVVAGHVEGAAGIEQQVPVR